MNSKILTTLNERDTLADMLSAEKEVMNAYNTAVAEGCNKGLRKEMLRHYSSVSENQFKVFSLMKDRGEYPVKSAEEQDIKTQSEIFKKFLQ